MRLKKNEVQSFQVDGATTINRYNFKTDAYDIVEIIVNGVHGAMMNKKSTKTYCITQGVGTFTIDEKHYEVEAGDIISARPNSWLNIKGQNLKALIITNPPFNPEDEEWR